MGTGVSKEQTATLPTLPGNHGHSCFRQSHQQGFLAVSIPSWYPEMQWRFPLTFPQTAFLMILEASIPFVKSTLLVEIP